MNLTGSFPHVFISIYMCMHAVIHIHIENFTGWEKGIEELFITFYKVGIINGTPKVQHGLNILTDGFTWSLTTYGHKITTSLCQVPRNLPSTVPSGKLLDTSNTTVCVWIYI